MTEGGRQLHATADAQIAELLVLMSSLDEASLRLPCPGREKLGDGTVWACARHTADNYRRIAVFVQAGERMTVAHSTAHSGGRLIPRFLRALGHGPADQAEREPSAGRHDDNDAADNMGLGAVLEQLSASRQALGGIAKLNSSQLDAVPLERSFRFCDGQRTLEQVLASLLKHQGHQIDALKAATN